MTACDRFATAEIELYFYGELEPVERARVEAHLDACAECRQHLSELHVIRRALAGRPHVDAPAAGDWSGFMRRLDDACRTVPAAISSAAGSSKSLIEASSNTVSRSLITCAMSDRPRSCAASR